MLSNQPTPSKPVNHPPTCYNCGKIKPLLPPFEEVIKGRSRLVSLCQECYLEYLDGEELAAPARPKDRNWPEDSAQLSILGRLRQAQGLSRRELAEKSGVDLKIIRGLEENRQKAYSATLEKLAAALVVSAGQLAELKQTKREGSDGTPRPRPRFNQGATSQVRQIRLQRGLTQQELADASGLNRNEIGGLELGTLKLKPAKLQRLAEALGVSVAELVSSEENVQLGFNLFRARPYSS